MSYVSSTLAPGEVVVANARYHWIIFRWSILLTLLALIFAFEASRHEDYRAPLMLCAAASLGLAALSAFPPLLRRWSTEICATNNRIIMKSGLLRTRTRELMLRNIQSMDVDQTILGRLLGYGSINCYSGAETERIRLIARPHVFVSAISMR